MDEAGSETEVLFRDFIREGDAPRRLKNSILRGLEEGSVENLPVADYAAMSFLQLEQIFISIPNFGKKTLRELHDVLRHAESFVPKPSYACELNPSYSTGSPELLFLGNKIELSVRLKNGLERAYKEDLLPDFTLSEIENLCIEELETIFSTVPGLGEGSIKELQTAVRHVAADLHTETPNQNASATPELDVDLGVVDKPDFESIDGLSAIEYLDLLEIDLNCSKKLFKRWRTIGKVDSAKWLVQEASRKHAPNYIGMTKEDSIEILNSFETVPPRESWPGLGKRLLSAVERVLSAKQWEVLVQREGLCGFQIRTLEDVAGDYGCTRERVRQIQKKCYLQLRILEPMYRRYWDHVADMVRENGGILTVDEASENAHFNFSSSLIALNLLEKKSIRFDRRNEIFYSRLVVKGLEKFNTTIDTELKSGEYGLSLSRLKERLPSNLAHGLEVYLTKKSDRYKCRGGKIYFVKESQTYLVMHALRAAGAPATLMKVAKKYQELFGSEITTHTLGATISRMSDALIVSRGAYALYEQLTLSTEDLADIRQVSFEYLSMIGNYVSSKVIYRDCKFGIKYIAKEPGMNPYMLHGILQDDDRFVVRRGLMVGLPGFEDMTPLGEEVQGYVALHAPVKTSEIVSALQGTRSILNVTVEMFLGASDEYVKDNSGYWNHIDRVVGDKEKQATFFLVCEMTSYSEKNSVYELSKALRVLGWNFRKTTIRSILLKHADLSLEDDSVLCDQPSTLVVRLVDEWKNAPTSEPTQAPDADGLECKLRTAYLELACDAPETTSGGILSAILGEFSK